MIHQFIDHLSEHAKQSIDRLSYALAAVSGAFTYANVMDALNMAAVVIAVLSGLVSLSWGLFRWRDRLKYGPAQSRDGD